MNTYSYDANGNMTCRVEGGIVYKQEYNAENRISSITRLAGGTCDTPGNFAAVWDFGYDGDGTRVSQLYTAYVNGVAQTPVFTAYFMGGAYEVTGTLDGGTFTQSSVTKYYAVAGMTVAMRDSGGLKYLLTDHLGSVVAVMSSTGTLISQQRYMPFGDVRELSSSARISETDYGYTGQRALGMGLMDYRARFYDSYLNRWTQPDSIVPDPANPQAWDRYSYTLNNPVRFNDPSGHVSCAGKNWDDGPQCTDKAEFRGKAADELRRIRGRADRDDWENDPRYISFDGGWNDPIYTNWNLLRMGSPCAACHVTHWTGTIPTNSQLDPNLVAYYRQWDPVAGLVHAYAFSQASVLAADIVIIGSATNGETADTILGRAAHKDYPNMLGEPGLDYNRQIPGTRLRPDAIDWDNNIVRELKPDTSAAIGRGLTQLGKYVDALQDLTGETWTGILDLYPKP